MSEAGLGPTVLGGDVPGDDSGRRDPAGEVREPQALGPVAVTQKELDLLEAAHLRLLGEMVGAATGDQRAEADGGTREARLSLVARGLLDEAGELPEDDDAALLVTTVLDVRLAADRVLVLERVVAREAPGAAAAQREWRTEPDARHGTRLVHLLDPGACVEDVLPDGSRHLYLLLDRAEVVPWVRGVTVPAGSTAAAGPAVTVRPDRPDEIFELLGRPTVLAELSVLPGPAVQSAEPTRRACAQARHLVALGPSGCWATTLETGRALPGAVVFHPVRPAWVGEWARSVMDGERSAVRPEEGGGQGTMCW